MTIDFRAPDPSRPDDVSVVAERDGRAVGRLDASSTDLTVPGGFRLLTAAIATIEVDEEHRHRGALTGMMEHALTRAHETGHVFACLSSPDATIHDRFGFGVATDRCSVEIDSCSAGPLRGSADGLVDTIHDGDRDDGVDAALATVAEIYDRCARSRPGTIRRTAQMWKRDLGEHPTATIAVTRDSTGLAEGYVRYDTSAAPTGLVHELWGATNDAERALWAHLLRVDGITCWRGDRPADDPLRFAVADIRSFRSGERRDELWLRLLDVDVALGTRQYNSSSRTLTLRVVDPAINSNSGTFRIDAYGSFRSQGDPELELGIDALSALYLGGTSFEDLHGAGRIRERRSGAARDADGLFAGDRLPYCGSRL